MDANGWTIIISGTIGAVVAGLPGVATFIISLRNGKKADVNSAKLDSLQEHAADVTQKLSVVSVRSTDQPGSDRREGETNAKP